MAKPSKRRVCLHISARRINMKKRNIKHDSIGDFVATEGIRPPAGVACGR